MPRGNYGVFEMPTIGEQIGPELQTLAATFQKFRNPNQDIQKALRDAIATNPDILQKLIDLGPDKVTKIFGKEAAFLTEGEQSLDKQIETEIGSLFKTDKTAREEIVAKKAGTKTSAEREIQGLDIAGKKIGNKANESQLRVQQATEQAQIDDIMNRATMSNQQITDMQTAVAAIPNIGSIDLGRVARQAMVGKGDPNTLMRLKQAGIDIGQLVSSLQDNANRAAQLSIAAIRRQPKEMQAQALAAIEKIADDKRNEAALADSELKNLQKAYDQTKFTLGMKDKTSPIYQSALQTKTQYEAIAARRAQILSELNDVWNPKRTQIINDLYADEFGTKKGSLFGDTSSGASTILEDVIPPTIAPYIAAAKAIKNPIELKKYMIEFKKKDPQNYERVAPYLKIK
jgi:hypothetical protein